ncbi:SDR family oxidoreductase, partial [Candidatus Poribacteria bacterium]|nr:SDR family oxidoreductase [Candidatus Poribacteria bacterium]
MGDRVAQGRRRQCHRPIARRHGWRRRSPARRADGALLGGSRCRHREVRVRVRRLGSARQVHSQDLCPDGVHAAVPIERVGMTDLRRFSLDGMNALVTGGSKGLGRAMALGLARAGADVAIASRTEATLDATAAEIEALGRRGHAFAADVSRVSDIRTLFQRVAEAFDSKLDILICAAGTNSRMPTTEYTEEVWDRIVDTNLKGTFFCCQEAGRLMVPRRFGRILTIGSITSSIGVATIGPYAATKTGVVGITKSLAIEWGAHGITVNC